MEFKFNPKKMSINKENLSKIGLDVLKMIYFYKYEVANDIYQSILPLEDYMKLKTDAEVHIKPLVLLLKLLNSLEDNNISLHERLSMEKFVHDCLFYEMHFLTNLEIKNFNNFNKWLSDSLFKMKIGLDFL